MAYSMAVEDILDENFASDEVLQDLRRSELRSMKDLSTAAATAEPHLNAPVPQDRFRMLGLLQTVSSMLAPDSMDNFFLSALMYDRASVLLPVPVHLAPARCVAIACLAMKHRQSWPLGIVNASLRKLRKHDYFVHFDLRQETITAEEKIIFKVQNYRMNIPCALSWLELFVRRVNIFSGWQIEQAMQHVLHLSTSMAYDLVLRLPCHMIQFHGLAAGLVALCMSIASVASWASLRPEHMVESAWDALGASSHPAGQMPQMPEDLQVLQHVLEAVDMSLPHLQDACCRVAEGMRKLARHSHGNDSTGRCVHEL